MEIEVQREEMSVRSHVPSNTTERIRKEISLLECNYQAQKNLEWYLFNFLPLSSIALEAIFTSKAKLWKNKEVNSRFENLRWNRFWC